ncbi:hypothetical protein E0E62_20915, partial [Streptomyces sp. 16-176A]
RPSPVARRPSPVARRPSPVARRPSPVARRPSPVARRPSPVARRPQFSHPSGSWAVGRRVSAGRSGFLGVVRRHGPMVPPASLGPASDPCRTCARPVRHGAATGRMGA